jgi:O-antigen/teichoic acid export membrane protein
MLPALIPDPVEWEPEFRAATGPSVPASLLEPSKVTRHLVSGTSVLGLGVLIERGSGFAANILAARLGGATTFGAYSLALSTANNIATYAGAGIGSTAARFSGKYQYGSAGYGMLARVLMLVSLVSAAAAYAGLWLAAGPLARLMGQGRLIDLLHWAALSAGGTILLECARGFFVGQRRLAALVLMSLIVGVGLLALLPVGAWEHNPISMITSQGCITIGAVVICLLLARQLHLLNPSTEVEQHRGLGGMLKEVWGFGLVQLAGVAGTNLVGWWLITLLARADTSLVQMGFFSIASQLRNIVGLAPSLLTESSYAVMADPEGEVLRTPLNVLGWITFASVMVTFLFAAIGIMVIPWLLRVLYSATYSHAAVAASYGLALAAMHTANGPASARLSILSIKTAAVINAGWAAFVALSGSIFMVHGGDAATVMMIYLGAHTLASILVLIALHRRNSLPRGMVGVFTIATGSTIALALLSTLRAAYPDLTMLLTATMIVLFACTLAALIGMGGRYGWIPTRAAVCQLARYVKRSTHRVMRRQSHAA